MSDNISSDSSWPTWKVALALGVPAVVVGAGLYYYTSRNKSSDTTLNEKSKITSRSEPEGSSSPQKELEVTSEVETPKKTKLQEAQDLKNEGNTLFKQGQYQEAINKYAEAIQVCPTSSKTKTDKSAYHQNMAAAMEKMENWEGVVKECSAAIELNQRYVKALSRRAKAYEKLKRKEESLEDITTVCILEGFQNQHSMMYADDILKQIGKENAADTYKKREPLMPSKIFLKQYFDSFTEDLLSMPLTEEQKLQSSDSGFIRAKIALDKKEYVNIIDECSAEIARTADEPQEGFENQQKEDFKAEAYLLRGTMHLLRGNSAAATDDFNNVIEMETAQKKLKANALIKRGSLKMQRQDPETAQGDFILALEVDPDNCDVYHHRGQLKILLDKADDALADFEKCIELKPDFAMAHAQKCYTIYRQACNAKDIVATQAAIGKFEQIIEKYPNCTETYGLFAQAHADNGNFERADQLFQKAAQIEAENATIFVHRGLLALQWKQDLEQAVSLISKALEIDEKCDFAHETMGTIEVQRGNLEKAVKHFDVAISYAKTELEMAHLFALRVAAKAQENIARKYGIRPPGGMM